jgi:hypothetical protein
MSRTTTPLCVDRTLQHWLWPATVRITVRPLWTCGRATGTLSVLTQLRHGTGCGASGLAARWLHLPQVGPSVAPARRPIAREHTSPSITVGINRDCNGGYGPALTGGFPVGGGAHRACKSFSAAALAAIRGPYAGVEIMSDDAGGARIRRRTIWTGRGSGGVHPTASPATSARVLPRSSWPHAANCPRATARRNRNSSVAVFEWAGALALRNQAGGPGRDYRSIKLCTGSLPPSV